MHHHCSCWLKNRVWDPPRTYSWRAPTLRSSARNPQPLQVPKGLSRPSVLPVLRFSRSLLLEDVETKRSDMRQRIGATISTAAESSSGVRFHCGPVTVAGVFERKKSGTGDAQPLLGGEPSPSTCCRSQTWRLAQRQREGGGPSPQSVQIQQRCVYESTIKLPPYLSITQFRTVEHPALGEASPSPGMRRRHLLFRMQGPQ